MPTIASSPFGVTPSGKAATLFTLSNDNGCLARITDLGGIVTELHVPDKNGKVADVVLGFKDLEGYLNPAVPYFGCIVGRFGNRIDKGRFEIDGKTYQLATNNGPNHLHGGIVGFDKFVWEATPLVSGDRAGLRLASVSPDGDEGYPGELRLEVTYWLTNANALRIEYRATTTATTPVNLTNHSYFNLKGEGEGDILDHSVQLDCPFYTPINDGLIPTGEVRPVAGTPFDFTSPAVIADRIEADDEQIRYGAGLDHNFVIARRQAGTPARAARVSAPGGARVMEVWTVEPAVQLYCGNFLDGSLTGKSGRAYARRNGFCLETQHFPDSPNHGHFPSTLLHPGEEYATWTEYRFVS